VTPARTRLALSAVALMLFVFFTSEVFASGALLQIEQDLDVSAGAVGSLTSSYAITAAVAIIPVSLLTSRVPVRVLLPLAVGVLCLSNAVVALAPSLSWMVAARCMAAVFHSVVWASGPAVAVWMLPGRTGLATSYVFIGSSLGSLLGAPAVAAVSAIASWRVAAAGLAVIATLCAGALAWSLPPGHPENTDLTEARSRVTQGSVRATSMWCLVVLFVAAAHLTSYTYITESATRAALPPALISVVLIGMGAAGLGGNVLAGRYYDQRPTGAVTVALVVLIVAFLGTALPVPWFFVTTAVWAAGYSALTVMMQASVLRDAPEWGRQASSWYILAFQLGIAAGSALGGATAITSHPYTSAALTVGAVGTFGLVASITSQRRAFSRTGT